MAPRSPDSFDVGPPAGPEEIAALAPILGVGFAFPAADAPSWLERAGMANVRVVREGAAAVGCLLLLPMGQWFGGRRLDMTGLAAVTVAPEHRGRGAAARLLRAVLRELRDASVPLSSLYPSTVPVYRKLGWELAGERWEAKLPLGRLQIRSPESATEPPEAPGLVARPATGADLDGIAAAHRLSAARGNGQLDRSDYIWGRIQRPQKDQEAQGYVVERAGRIEGHVFVTHRRSDRLRFDLRISDLVALTPAAARRLLELLAGWRSIAEHALVWGAAQDPVLALLDDPQHDVYLWHRWMLRLVHVPLALSGRGYPEHLRGELHLEISDDALPENAGRYVLEVAGGRAEIRSGGEGSLRLDVTALAALYASYRTPYDLVAAGLAAGSDADLRLAGALFAGPPPSMPDHF